MAGSCPRDQLKKSGTVCRPNVTECDVPEQCDGLSSACPPDAFRVAGQPCRPAKGTCDLAEQCNGTSAFCPDDVMQPLGFVCRAANGTCDIAEACPGDEPLCPADVREPAATVCRSAAGVCDVAEVCDGTAAKCPADTVRSAASRFVCRDATGACDLPEVCDGTNAVCPADKFAVGTTCRPAAAGKICDLAELCVSAPDCPADAFAVAGAVCNDRNSLTTGDQCDAFGDCSGLCTSDKACADTDNCTEDTCSMDTGRCTFTPIVGCVPVPPPLPPVNCLLDASFRFDLLAKPAAGAAGDVVTTCFFPVTLSSLDGAKISRTFSAANAQRAVSFGIASSDGGDAKIRANTTLIMRFPAQWTAAIESLTISSVGVDTLLAVVRDSPETQRANVADAVRQYDASGGNRTVTKGVWIILQPGEQLAPPAIVAAPAGAWSVMHVRGRPFSVDVVKFSRPVNAERKLEWFPVAGGIAAANTTAATTATLPAAIEPPSDSGALVGGIIGGLIALLVVVGGAFAAGIWWTRRNAAARDGESGGAATPSDTQLRESSMQQQDGRSISAYHSLPIPTSQGYQSIADARYIELPLSPRAAGTRYDDGRELTADVHDAAGEEVTDFT
jgi:hypothetical protein